MGEKITDKCAIGSNLVQAFVMRKIESTAGWRSFSSPFFELIVKIFCFALKKFVILRQQSPVDHNFKKIKNYYIFLSFFETISYFFRIYM